MSEAERKIIHIDMDAFYASVEQRDNPELQGQPVIVGGRPGSRGVVAACSYEARKFGVRSAMPAATAQRHCPNAVFVKPRFEEYRKVSQQIHEVFRGFTDLIEPLSLDEAFLDVSGNPRWQGSATLMAKEIKARIKLETRLTASAGVSYNKFLAKIASDMDKPDGLYVIKPEDGPRFIAQLPIGKFFGVGKATEKRMHKHGIKTGADILQWSQAELLECFGKQGKFYYQIARGIDHRPVNPSRERKSISTENTFSEDLTDKQKMLAILFELADKVSETLKKKNLLAKTIVVKVKYNDFVQVTRSETMPTAFDSLKSLQENIAGLLDKTRAGEKPVRLLGVGVSQLQGEINDEVEENQLSLL